MRQTTQMSPSSDFDRPSQSKPATAATAERNRLQGKTLDMDGDDFERASRGLIASHPTGIIDGPYGPAWDLTRYSFIDEAVAAAGAAPASSCPDTVHPSLWRQARLNQPHGLFKVDDGLWQARGYDISNITFIEGETGWIIIDPLTTEWTARACLELANEHLGERPVQAVIYTHSHADHFGGIEGVTSQEAVDAGEVRIIAPEGFMREAVAENIIAGPAMARRSTYQFGPLLPVGPRGHVDCGLGKAFPTAPPGLIAPTESIGETGQELTVDGVRIIFQYTPEAEAPAEMTFFFPDKGWLCMAENCSHNMHNLVPIRGAQVRDTLSWSKYIDEALQMFGSDTTIMFASHHWPRWGQENVAEFLAKQRDLYRWIHDQTMRQANHGFTGTEIAEMLELPQSFLDESHTRGYYGTLVHNVKAVYSRYLSFYDGNPASLWNYPPAEAGQRYVEFMGGADKLVSKAKASFDQGDYRWVVQVLNHLVFSEPSHQAGRSLQADAFEQLGYGCESATWRNAYLMGAQELREGPPPSRETRRGGLLQALELDQIFDAIAVRLQSESVVGLQASIHWHFTDLDEHWLLSLDNQALSTRRTTADTTAAAGASLTLSKAALVGIIAGQMTFPDAIADGSVTLAGDPENLLTVFGNLDTFRSNFAIVEP